jgi:hypothetical protein
MKRRLTLREREAKGEHTTGRQNTVWADEIVTACDHDWQPVHMVMENSNKMPHMTNNRTYCVCLKCCAYTYVETAWVGYYLAGPDILEQELINSNHDS